MLQQQALMIEFESKLTNKSSSQRFTILRQITDLFLAHAGNCPDEHVAICDELMCRLMDKIEREALIELSGRLAPVDRAPSNVIGRLSRDDDIAISGPILEHSNALNDNDLVDIAKTKSQDHLSAIAGRKRIGEPVTDVLIDRGDSRVALKVTGNTGARFSRFGMARAVQRAEQDEALAITVAGRADLSPELFDHLVSKATVAVKKRLMQGARPEMRQRIAQVVSNASKSVAQSEAPSGPRGRGGAAPRQNPARTRERISQSVQSKNVDELVDALAIHCEVPVNAIKGIIQRQSDEGMLILGKASGIGWQELKEILLLVLPSKTKTPEDVKSLFESFVKVTPADAQRAIRFIRTSQPKHGIN